MMRLVNLALAEIGIILTVKSLENSFLSTFITMDYVYTLLLIPPIFAFANRNPFDFRLFVFLLCLMSVNLLPSSKSFDGVLNSLYYFGFQGWAMFLESTVKSYESNAFYIPPFVVVFTISQITWTLHKKSIELKERGVKFDVLPSVILAFIVGLISLVLFFYLPTGFQIENNLMTGLAGISLLILGFALLKR